METVTLDDVRRLIAEAFAPLSARITELEKKVADNAAKYNQDVLIFAPKYICNVAAQILLFNEYPNSKIHFRDWNALERNVIQIRGLFLRHPKLREMLEDEHYVIQKFEEFRASPLCKDPVTQLMFRNKK